jgi:hypothetical protein
MSGIQRWSLSYDEAQDYVYMAQDDEGDYVTYADHVEAMTRSA